MRARFGLIGGLVVFTCIALGPAPPGMEASAQKTAAVAALMAVWWLTEAVPVPVTGLVPLVGFPLTGVISAAQISAPYASQTNMLFLGGLVIATAIERWGLHRRIALHTIARLGGNPAGLLLGFMCATAGISMWISNSATTMMMLPIALAVNAEFAGEDPEHGRAFGPVLMLAVAYSATIGGLGTIVGTPPNAVFAGMLPQLFPDAPEVGFLQWMLVGVPVVLVMIPVAWAYLTWAGGFAGRRQARVNAGAIRRQLESLGRISVPERRVLVLFCATAALWMFRRPLDLGALSIPGWSSVLPDPKLVGDSTVAVGMSVLLFMLPAGNGTRDRILDWDWAVKLPWGVIVLLGGGFALAEAIRASGLAAWLGERLAWVGQAPPAVSIVSIATIISFATEITTNTAITTIMMPILAASAIAGGCDPLLLMIPCTLAASLCFMMPSGTAPNAIVFSGGNLRVAYMARVGLGLNLIAIAVVSLVSYFVAVPVFGVSLHGPPTWAVLSPPSVP